MEVAAGFFGAAAADRWPADAEGSALQAEAAAIPTPVARRAAPANGAKRVRMWPVL